MIIKWLKNKPKLFTYKIFYLYMAINLNNNLKEYGCFSSSPNEQIKISEHIRLCCWDSALKDILCSPFIFLSASSIWASSSHPLCYKVSLYEGCRCVCMTSVDSVSLQKFFFKSVSKVIPIYQVWWEFCEFWDRWFFYISVLIFFSFDSVSMNTLFEGMCVCDSVLLFGVMYF